MSLENNALEIATTLIDMYFDMDKNDYQEYYEDSVKTIASTIEELQLKENPLCMILDVIATRYKE